MRRQVPTIDLFSGPGGLAEGFASLGESIQRRRFRIALSIEMDQTAYLTLRLRAFLRKFRSNLPKEYYEYLNGELSEEPDWSTLYPVQWRRACNETRRLRLGSASAGSFLLEQIRQLRKTHAGRTVLLGGPPCQSYSLAGRARNSGKRGYDADKDERQSLYIEYAMALSVLRPAVAVMENVQGILSARLNNEPVFPKVMESLRHAGSTDGYRLYGLACDKAGQSWADGLEPEDFLVRAESHGVPQSRHRVFVICIRRDIAKALPEELFPKLEQYETEVTVQDVIGNMPALRSRLSRSDCAVAWQQAVREAIVLVECNQPTMAPENERKFRQAIDMAFKSTQAVAPPHGHRTGGIKFGKSCPEGLRDWLFDANLTRLPNNQTRGHIPKDLARYLYAGAFAFAFGKSPKSSDFPKALAPKHANWNTGKFIDRFRVQLPDRPSSTITSHISKDGHYFIHPDPAQCRSLTVREAARLQTFPDNYFFCGGRTQQYVQVGNAVPPFLARQIATQIAKVFEHHDRETRKPGRQLRQSTSTSGPMRTTRSIARTQNREAEVGNI